jgi:hypothetical protein
MTDRTGGDGVRQLVFALGVIVLSAAACGERKEAEAPKTVQPLPPGSIRVSHILISYSGVEGTMATRTKDEAESLAQDLLVRIKAGESFEELAQTYSDDPDSQNQGDLGFLKKGRMVRQFEDAAFSLNVGEVSAIVETRLGYHIIKRTQ